jgi:kinetochore protein NDC80
LPTTKYHGGPLERPLSEDDEDFCHYFPYLWLCYEQFWDGQNEYPEEKARLEEIFEERAKQARQELEQLLEAERHLSARLKEFQASEPPLAVEETENAVLKSDVEKFLAYKEKVLEPRILQCETGAEEFRRESEKHEGRLHRLSRDRDILQEQVDAQNVSANDFEQMSRQREQLGELLKKVMARLQDQSSENSHTEISLSNKQSRVEDELKDLSDKCRELGMFPYTLPNGGQLFDFDIVAGNTSTMLPKGLDLRNDLRRRIAEKKEKLLSLYRKVTSEKIKDQEDFDVMMEDVGEKREETTKLERKVETVNEQTDSMKTSWKVESLDQAKVDADNDLTFAQMNQAGRNTLDLAEKRLQSAQMQITQVRDRDDEMREELVKEYTKGLETIFSLKTDVAEAFKLMEEAISKQER